ncbi:HNH endonuclease family protein [Cutibacterium sp.]|uniref:HNH endonuclease family protein n=1 Tax=Cutibacterium sp. TaxID=1912221 RepID=UPI0026DB23ED|nr:HNH endonuclease family protein [Cutibacterium sp.]MDO4413162.1 HNH endonuclease family protein [Cutibacterium sp.]
MVLLVAAALVLVGVYRRTAPDEGSTAYGQAAEALGQLPVKGRAPMTGYAREQFGSAWDDDSDPALTRPWGHNGCGTRDDALARDLVGAKLKSGSRCVVASGTLHDPYTGRTITWKRGRDTSAVVQIDHVVALANAWVTGAQQLSMDQRQALANDPLNLLAVEGKANQQKSAGDAATWLPPNKSYRCDYVSRQIVVKKKYHLWVTSAERNAMVRVLSTCPNHPLPAR